MLLIIVVLAISYTHGNSRCLIDIDCKIFSEEKFNSAFTNNLCMSRDISHLLL